MSLVDRSRKLLAPAATQGRKLSERSTAFPIGLLHHEDKGKDCQRAQRKDVVEPPHSNLGICNDKYSCWNISHPWYLEGKEEDQGNQVKPESQPRA